MQWLAPAQLNNVACLWNHWQPGTLSLWEGESPVLLKEMNDGVFVLGLLGKEFMRMANSVSTKFMTWPWISVAPCFVMLVFVCVRLIKWMDQDVSITRVFRNWLTVKTFEKKLFWTLWYIHKKGNFLKKTRVILLWPLLCLVPVMLTCGDKRFSPDSNSNLQGTESQTVHHPLIKSSLHDLRAEQV